MSQADLAKMLGKDKNTLGSYERGQTVPDQDFLRAFARATGSSFDELNSVLDASVRVASGSWSDSVIGVEKYVADFTRRHLQLAAEHAGFSLADDPDFEVLRETLVDLFELEGRSPKSAQKTAKVFIDHYRGRLETKRSERLIDSSTKLGPES